MKELKKHKRKMLNDKKTLSLIINRGCHWKCHYCFTKQSQIDVCNKLPELSHVEKSITNHKVISVSGGGDPLWDYHTQQTKQFYKNLLTLAKVKKLQFELHTSMLKQGIEFSANHKVWLLAFHVLDYHKIPEYYSHSEITRIVIVNETKYSIFDYLKMLKLYRKNKNLQEFSIRQLVDGKGTAIKHNEWFLKLGHKLKWWYYILQNDYNEYFVNDKKINKFLAIKKLKNIL